MKNEEEKIGINKILRLKQVSILKYNKITDNVNDM